MDLPPRFRHHLRYGNVLHPPHFIPHHLPPPPPPPPHILFPPSHSLPPPLHDAHLPVPSSFSFSPPHHPILERSHVLEFDPPRKPSFDRCVPPPLQPPENFHFRLIHDYPEPEPNLIFEDQILRRRCDHSFIHDLSHHRDQNLHWVAREVNSRVSDIEHSGRYRKFSDLEVREFCNERNDDVGRRNYAVNQGRELYIERYDDARRCDYGFNDGAFLQFENRRPVFVESNFGLGRFSGRLVREGWGGDFVRSKKRRTVQKKSARRRHSRGSNILKKLNSGCFEGKEKVGFDCLETRSRDKWEREQSPLQISISFKSNSLVAQAIVVPSSPAGKADMVLTPGKRNIRKIYCRDDSPLTKSGKEILVTEHGLDFQSGLPGSITELPEKSTVYGNGCVTANNANDLGDNGVANKPLKDANSQSSNNAGSDRRLVHSLKIKRRDRKQLLHGTNLQMTKDNGSIVSDKIDIDGDSSQPFVSKSKRKRSCLSTLTTSLHAADDASTDCPGHSGRVVSTTEDADCASKLVTDKVTVHSNESTRHGESLDFCQHFDNLDIYVHNLASVLKSEKYRFESDDLFTRLDTGKVDSISEQPFQDGPVSLEKSFSKRPIKDPTSFEGLRIAGLSRPKKVRISEVHVEDEHFSEYHEFSTASDSESVSLKMIERVSVSDMGSADANSKELFANQATRVCGPSDADEIRLKDGTAVTDCSNVNLGSATSSNFLSVDNEGIVTESDISLGNNLIEQSCDNGANLPNKISGVEKSQEAINHAHTFFSSDYSSKIKRKRKARGVKLDITCSNINKIADVVSSRDGELASLLPKDLSSAEEFGFPGEKYHYAEGCSLNEGPSGDEGSPQDGIDFLADCSFPSYRKKKKVVSPKMTLSFLSADYSTGDSLASSSKLDQLSPKLPESGTDPRGDTPSAAPTATNKSDTTFMEGTDARENLSMLDMVDTLANGNRIHVNEDISFIPNTSLYADANGVCATKSGEELITTGFDMPPCMSSPEDLVSYSDSSFTRDTKTSPNHSENEMIFGSLKTSNLKPVSGDSKTFSLRKSIENSTSKYKQTNDEVSPSLPQDGSKLVREFSFISGNLPSSKNQLTSSVPKVFPSHPALCLSTSRKFPSAHVMKSRTWHRTGTSSIAVAGTKLQSSSLPHGHATRNSQGSYIRKGNSLVRKPSSSGVPPSKFHTLSSSDCQLSSCVDNLKKSQAFNIKTDVIDAPSISSTGQVNTYERPEGLPLNHIGKSLNCASYHTAESLPVANSIRNDCPAKSLDTLEETVESSAIPECHTGSGNNSHSQSTLDKGKPGKKITYVKCRLNQLVAASDYEDPSITGANKSQAPLSDGYYKKRKNQLIRSSLENHVKKADAVMDLNSLSLGSRTNFSRSSGKRQSSKGFAKSRRHFSFVWKLHDTQLSDKHSSSIGHQKVWPYLFPWKKATYRRSFIHALGSKPNSSSLSTISQKLLLSSKRGAIYTRSTHGYSLRISKMLSVGGSSLKWSKSIERNSKKANEEATQAVAAAEKRKKEGKGTFPIVLKTRSHVSRKSVLSVKLRPGEWIFRVGSERYKMDPTRRTLHRITAVEEPSTSVAPQTEKNNKRSCFPRRLLIGNDEYVRIGNGNQLVRDPKKRTRILASEKVRWSLRTARLRLVRKKKYCQFFTRFGKCNKSDGKCPYIHDPSKIVVCTKYLNDSCTDLDCKLTHKVIPERMQDCSYFLKGSCSNENCPYRHVNVNPDSSICEGFLRGYCVDGNECRKKHTYVCPAFEEMGICSQASTCKLHHPKKKTERKPMSEQKNVRGRYFDGGLINAADCSVAPTERLSAKGNMVIDCVVEKFPDYISLDLRDEEMEN